jgi:hypothetical protein
MDMFQSYKTYKEMDLLQLYKRKHIDRWICYNRITKQTDRWTCYNRIKTYRQMDILQLCNKHIDGWTYYNRIRKTTYRQMDFLQSYTKKT